MMSLTDRLVRCATSHRDRRNLAIHFVGIPIITVGLYTLLSRPGWEIGGILITPALVQVIGTLIYYLRLDLRFGLAMVPLKGLALWAGYALAAQETSIWLAWGIGLFVAGWLLQFVGHYFEGKKPSIANDWVAGYIGPLLLMSEAAYALGLRKELQTAVEAQVGPTHVRKSAALV